MRQAGADLLVAGTAVFRAERPTEAMARLRGRVEKKQGQALAKVW